MWEPIIFFSNRILDESTREEDPIASIHIVEYIWKQTEREKRRRRPLIVAFEIWGLAWNTNKDANGTMKYKTTEINIFGEAKTILSSKAFYHQFSSTSPKLLFWNELSIRDRFTVIYTVAFDFRSDSITFRRYHKV